MKPHGIRFLDELGEELARVESEPAAPSRVMPRGRLTRPRPLIAAVVALALAGGAAAGVVATDDAADTTGLRGARDRTTIAEGTTRAGSPWVLTTGYDRGGLAGDDRESFCISLRVTGPRGPEASIACGPITPGEFSAALAEDPGEEAGLIFGTAPADAATVAIFEPGSSPSEYETLEDEAGMLGRFYVVDAGGDYRDTRISFRDARGHDLHAPETIMEFFARIG